MDGHGNFGSIEGDGAAAMRYTEARLEKVTQEAFLADLDKDVVNFVPNFDEDRQSSRKCCRQESPIFLSTALTVLPSVWRRVFRPQSGRGH